MKITGKSILITGASGGIGKALAIQAAQNNMHVHLLSRTMDKKLVDEVKSQGAKDVRFWEVDLSQRQEIEAFSQRFFAEGFHCDILINNAGQLTGGLLEEQSIDEIYQMFQVNLVGLVHLTRLFLPKLLKQPEAKIVNNASVSGIMFLPCASTYAASKAGVVAFTECLRNELRGSGVSTLVLVTPGVKTKMYDDIPNKYSSHLDVKKLSSIPPEDWAKQVFLAIAKDKTSLWPRGSTYWGVKMGQHFPDLLGRMVHNYFQR